MGNNKMSMNSSPFGSDFFARRAPTTRRPQTALNWHEQEHPYVRQQREAERQQQQRRQELLKQRQAQELDRQKRLAAQKMYSYGFTNLQHIKQAIDECGPDVNACVRWLLVRERQARQHDG